MNATVASPWTRRDAGLFAGLTAVGTGLIAVAWAGSSNELRLGDDEQWLFLAVVGLLLAHTGAGLWFLTGRRAVLRQSRTVLELRGVVPGFGQAQRVATGTADQLVAVPGMRRFHRAECRLVADKTVETASAAEHWQAERIECGVCRP